VVRISMSTYTHAPIELPEFCALPIEAILLTLNRQSRYVIRKNYSHLTICCRALSRQRVNRGAVQVERRSNSHVVDMEI